MKLLLTFLFSLVTLAASGQTKAVLKNISGNTLTEALVVPSGGSIIINSGGNITNNGTATGFGGGGHTIKADGSAMTARTGLNFSTAFVLSDDAGNNETDVGIDGASFGGPANAGKIVLFDVVGGLSGGEAGSIGQIGVSGLTGTGSGVYGLADGTDGSGGKFETTSSSALSEALYLKAPSAAQLIIAQNATTAGQVFAITSGNGGAVVLGGQSSSTPLYFMEPSGSGANYTSIQAQAQAANIVYTLPAADGSSGQPLKTNGSGTLSWGTLANAALANSSITIAGSATSLGGSISASAILDSVGTTQGSVLYRNASIWTLLGPGLAGQVLQSGGAGGNPAWSSDGSALTALNASSLASGAVPTARLGSGTANSTTYLRGDQTWQTISSGDTPGGSGTEIQYRAGASTLGAVTNSSVSGTAITLGAAESLGTTPTSYLSLQNTTSASAGAQQVSPSLRWSGRGWKTDATAESRTVDFKSYLLPVQGTANPSANLVFGSEINGAAFTESFRIYSQGSTYAASMSSNAGTTYFSVGGGGVLYTSASIFATVGNIGPVSDSGLLFIGTNQQVLFAREAAYTFGIRNGTNPMAIRLFETDNGANDEYLEISAAAGTNTIKPTKSGTGTASKLDIYPTETVRITSGTGSPESAVTAEVGSLYLRTDGGASTTLYVKESGSGNTGWVAK